MLARPAARLPEKGAGRTDWQKVKSKKDAKKWQANGC